MKITISSWAAIGPHLVLTIGAILLLIFGALRAERKWQYVLAFGTLFGAALLVPLSYDKRFPTVGTVSYLKNDLFSTIFFGIFLFVAFVTIILTIRYFFMHKKLRPELFSLLFFAVIGMMIMVSAWDFLVFYLGLELMSLTAYLLAGFLIPQKRSQEAALKYFLTGALGSAIFLFGFAYIYGATGAISFSDISSVAHQFAQSPLRAPAPFFWIGIVFVIAGFSFKVAAVPFHMWAPDVYEGSPTPITAFMTVGIKGAAFAAFSRVIISVFDVGSFFWFDALLFALAAGTMIWGNLAAIAQKSIKRMLAYSSLAHAGYLLLGIAARSDWSGPAIAYYFFSYALMNLGAFAVIVVFEDREGNNLEIKQYAGLASQYPLLSITLAIFLLSLAGIPPTVGFTAKWFLFGSAITTGKTHLIALAVIGVMASVLSVYYYLRVIYYMFMLPSEKDTAFASRPFPSEQRLTTVLAIAIILFGLFPPFEFAESAKIYPAAKYSYKPAKGGKAAAGQGQKVELPRPTPKVTVTEIKVKKVKKSAAPKKDAASQPLPPKKEKKEGATSRPATKAKESKTKESPSPAAAPTAKAATRPATKSAHPATKPTTAPKK